MKPIYAACLVILFAVDTAFAQDTDAVEALSSPAVESTAPPSEAPASTPAVAPETEPATPSEAAPSTPDTSGTSDTAPAAETPAEADASAKPAGAAPAGGLSEAEMAKANNPLADSIALNLHSYYMPESKSNLGFLRLAVPFVKGRLLMRATLPIQTMPVPDENQRRSGIGDLNVFLSINVISKATTTFGFGPLLNAPTTAGTEDLRDVTASKWQLGAAMVLFKVFSPVVQFGTLLTWQMSLGDKPDLKDQNLIVAQPILMIQLGKGIYLRSAAMWTFDVEYGHYTIPFGLGLGKVIKAEKVVFNGFMEPTFTLFSNNPDQPLFQLFTGLNLQFVKG